MDEPITREEMFLAKAAGEDVNIPEPITREEMYLAKAAGVNINITMLDPITRKERYLHALAESGGGGGSSVAVESLSVTENGTTTAPTGKAYSPVVVNVPNSYSAGDEGKVVSNGALVAQTAHAEVTENGTIDTTLNNSVVVNVPTGGGASNVVFGNFTGAAVGNQKVTVNYTGSGYPVALLIWLPEGVKNVNGTVYPSSMLYIVAYAMFKDETNTTPTYGSSGAENAGGVMLIYKNTTGGYNWMNNSGAEAANIYTANSPAAGTNYQMCVIHSATEFEVWIKNPTNTMSYSFPKDIEYNYCVIYSE